MSRAIKLAVKLRQGQRGVSLIIGIFVIVVVSMLGAAMVSILQQGGEAIAREVISTRALMAAESGAERLLNQILVGGIGANCSANVNAPTTPASLSNPLLLSIDGMNNCSADQRCAVVTVDGVNYYHVRSEGRCGAAPDQAVRIVEVQARQ